MTMLQIRPGMSEGGVLCAATPDGLSAIHHAGCAAAIWARDPLVRFQTWIDRLPPDHLPRARVMLRPDRVCDALLDITRLCNTPDCAERDMLVEDIAALSAIFAEVMQAPYLRLRLDVVTTNACRKFHVDAVTARLVCTYRGSGTQYGVSRDEADPAQIRSVPTGSPVVLRGTQWPETPLSRLLHRSPPIEGTGETRLLLVLDPVTDPGMDPGTENHRHFTH